MEVSQSIMVQYNVALWKLHVLSIYNSLPETKYKNENITPGYIFSQNKYQIHITLISLCVFIVYFYLLHSLTIICDLAFRSLPGFHN